MAEEQCQFLEQKAAAGVFHVEYDWVVDEQKTWHYVIDLEKMTQRNETTGTTRRIRRLRIAPEAPCDMI